MAGKRHHTIPQFLSRNFASNVRGDRTYVWVYRRASDAFETNSINVAVEGYFYGKPAETDLDERITLLEGDKYAPLIERLRSNKTGTHEEVFDTDIPSLIAHLSMRTGQVREGLTDMFGTMLKKLNQTFTDSDHLTAMLAKGFRKDGELRDAVRNSLKERGLPSEHVEMALHHLEPHWEEVAKHVLNEDEVLPTLHEELRRAETQKEAVVKNSHIEALSENLTATPREAEYAQFHWWICRPAQPLILGDSVTVFETTDTRRFAPMATNFAQVIRIYLPLAPDAVLVGSKSNVQPMIDWRLTNKAIARCSQKFFISSQRLDQDAHLAKGIGLWSGLLSDDEKAAFLEGDKLELF